MSRKCPKCGSSEVVPIIYGYPSGEAHDRVARGEAVLGGCCITFDDPKWHCKKCKHRWGIP